MRFFYDCEFIEDGTTIDLVSIGVVGEDGREFYAVSAEFDPSRAGAWVRANVLPKLPSPSDPAWRSRTRLRADQERDAALFAVVPQCLAFDSGAKLLPVTLGCGGGGGGGGSPPDPPPPLPPPQEISASRLPVSSARADKLGR